MSKTILVADDSRTIQEVVRLALQGEGYELVPCSNGMQAFQRAREVRPNLIVADLHMPEGTGDWLTKQVRADPQLATTPILLLHPSKEAPPEQLGQAIGASGLLAKPFLSSELIERCRQLLQPAAARPVRPPTVPELGVAQPAAAGRTSTPSLAERISRMEEVLGRRGGTGAPSDTIAFAAQRTGSPSPRGPLPEPPSAPPDADAVVEALRQAGRAARIKGPSGKAAPASSGGMDTELRQTAKSTQMLHRFGQSPGREGEAPIPLTQPIQPPALSTPGLRRKEVQVPTRPAAGPPPAELEGERHAITREELLEVVRQVTQEAVERVIWELVPDLAEKILWETLPEITETIAREQLEAASRKS